MARTPMLFININTYLAQTVHLNTLEHGAYLLLLIAMRCADGRLPADDQVLARCAKLSVARWTRIKPIVMMLMRVEDGFVMPVVRDKPSKTRGG